MAYLTRTMHEPAGSNVTCYFLRMPLGEFSGLKLPEIN